MSMPGVGAGWGSRYYASRRVNVLLDTVQAAGAVTRAGPVSTCLPGCQPFSQALGRVCLWGGGEA